MTVKIPVSDVARVNWTTQFQYENATNAARQAGKPVLLDLHSASSVGCRALEENVFSDPAVIAAVNKHTVPVRIHVDSREPDPCTSRIVGSHIFIWSQTVQIVSPDGDIYHKFSGAPRHTRLDQGYTRVHHDVDGNLDAAEFLAQLELGLGKAAMFEGNYREAVRRLSEAVATSREGSLSRQEAAYWLPIAESYGVYPDDKVRRVTKTKSRLARVVERFCEALVQIPDSELMLDWHGEPGPGAWAKYTDCLREVTLGAYQEILDVANAVEARRVSEGQAPTGAQRILRHHQVAYRELQGTVVGLRGRDFDQVHLRENYSLGKQRTIRNNLVHCVMAEWWAHAAQIRGTLEAYRTGGDVHLSTASETLEEYGDPPYNFGDPGELIARSEVVHQKLVEEFSTITDEELDSTAQWWEDTPVPVRFRLNRLGWHLHDHAAVVDTILERIGRKRTETERLARLIYRALGDLEGSMIGMPSEAQEASVAEMRAFLEGRCEELEKLADGFLRKAAD